jgi:hypothetical protein
MFIKLNFTVDKTTLEAVALLHHIISNPSIVDIPTFSSSLDTLHVGLSSGFDAENSELIRTVDPDRVVSHLSKSTTTSRGVHTLQFDVYNNQSQKYYIQLNAALASSIRTFISDTLVGSQDLTTRSSVDLSSVNLRSTESGGDSVNLGTGSNSADTLDETSLNITASGDVTRCIWAYITNECFIYNLSLQTSTPSGWNTSYNTLTNAGPYIYSQYQNFDQFMRSENGIVPLMFTSHFRGGGFGMFTDWARIDNVLFTKPTTVTTSCPAFQILNGIDAYPQAVSTWPKLRSPFVSWGSGSRTNDQFALISASGGSATTSTTTRYGRVINTGAYHRYPSADRRSTGYAMLPLRWELSYYGLKGGNATAVGGMYIFNGEYVAGDLFNYNGKTYMIWPTNIGYTVRVGLAIPKE